MSYVDSPTFRRVEAKAAWGDAWVTVPNLYPEDAVIQTSPGIGAARLTYEFGRITGTGLAPYVDRTTLNLKDHYVRIVCQYGLGFPWEEPEFGAWLGIITDDEIDVVAGDFVTGRQTFEAREISHEWDRVFLTRAKARRDTTPVDLDYLPTFNRRREIGTGVYGNRATAKLGSENFYRFDDRKQSTADDVWLARDVVEYIIANHRPSQFTTVTISDPADVLNQYEQVWDLEGRSSWEALNAVIDRRRGVSFWFDISGTNVILRVFTVTPTPITIGSSTIPANTTQGAFTIPSTFPDRHILQSLLLRTTTRAAYNRVIVRGERIRVLGTFCLGNDGQLVKGWSAANETSYNDPGGSPASEKDRRRTRDKFQSVYKRYIVKRSWNGETGDEVAANRSPLLFAVAADGTINTNSVGGFWMGGKRFLRDTFLQRDFDYTQDPPVDNSPGDANLDYVPIICLIKDTLTTAERHAKTDKWINAERISQVFQGINSGVQITPLDNQLGFEVEMNPPHLLAGATFTGQTELARPEFDFEMLAITAALEHDQRIKIRREIAGGENRELFIDVPEAHYWWVHPKAAIGVKDDGTVETCAKRVLRDDRERLEAIAAAASAWYSVPRQAVTFPLRRIRQWVAPGYLITSIVGFSVPVPVNAVVTSIAYDFRGNGMVQIQTGWGERDYAPSFL